MKEKIKGKIFVGIIISLLAFGLATGASIFIGTNPFNSTITNLTQQGQFPSLPFSPSNTTSNNQQVLNTTTNPTTPQQTITPSKSNTSKTNKNNTKQPTNTTPNKAK